MSQSLSTPAEVRLRRHPVLLRCIMHASLLVLASVVLTRPAFACPVGIQGISNPNSTVCAQNASGTTWCTTADANGNFNLTGANVPPSTGTGCLPVSGTYQVYNVACAPNGRPVDRGDPQQRFGGSWLDVRCAACVPAPAGMMAWYRLDEPSGNVAHDFPNISPPASATLFGSPAHVPGMVGNGLQFDGVNDYAQGGAGKNVGTGDFSIDLWVRVPTGLPQGFHVILDKRTASPLQGYHLVLVNGSPLLQLADASGWTNYPSGLATLADGQWHLLAVTVRRAATTGIQWYLDGAPAGTSGNPMLRPGTLNSTAPLRLGARSVGTPGSPGWFRGTMDELEIFNRMLSPAEVNAIFQARSGGKCKRPLPRPVGPSFPRDPVPDR